MRSTYGTKVRCNQREAKHFAALLSPTRNMVPLARGVYFMPADDEVQALRDAEFLAENGARLMLTA